MYVTRAALVGAMFMACSTLAQAASVTPLDWSTNGSGNAAATFAGSFGAYLPTGATFDRDPAVGVPGNISGVYQSPFNNTSLLETRSFFSVGATGTGGGVASPATLSFASAQARLDILIGSIDSYNSITFAGAFGSQTFTGTDLVNRIAPTSAATNYEIAGVFRFDGFGPGGFDRVTFASSTPALEFALAENLSDVPVPGAVWLLAAGLGGLALVRRRR